MAVAAEKVLRKETVLVVEDEPDIRELVCYNLEREAYRVIPCASGEEALEAARRERPSLVLLDLMLPGIDGLDVCRMLKKDEATAGTPVIILSARGEEIDVVTGLELGADDYITKPFAPRVLLARVRASLRRSQSPEETSANNLEIHGIRIHIGRHEVWAGESKVELSPTEFRILHLLARKAGWVFTRNQIVDAIRGQDYAVTERSVDVQVVGLRRKLGDYGDLVETVRGVGYRFRDAES